MLCRHLATQVAAFATEMCGPCYRGVRRPPAPLPTCRCGRGVRRGDAGQFDGAARGCTHTGYLAPVRSRHALKARLRAVRLA